jgi:nucleoside-diphosphate-sugar epimerase
MILITGASGFVGAHLTRALSESGARVRALYYRNEPTQEMRSWPGVEWLQADLLDIYDVDVVMEGILEIYHCAAIVSFNPARKEEMIHTNTEITANIANAAIDAGVRKLVHISSVASLGRNGTTKEITEEAQWEENSLNSGYGLSKYGSEMEVWRIIGEGLDAVILNPGIILGEPLSPQGWQDGSARLMQTAYKEFPFFTDGITGFVDINDVVGAAIKLMQSDVSAERFILSAGNFPFRDIFNHMADALGRRRPRFHAGAFATSLVWRWSALQSRLGLGKPIITKETARNAQLKSFYKADKIIGALPEFRYTPIEKTIARMAQRYLAELVA